MIHAIKLNTGRNALEYLLRAHDYKKVYLPYYICSSVLEPIKKLNLEFEFYSIDDNFNAQLDLNKIQEDELLVYVNYFGVCDDKVDELIEKKKLCDFNLCIDNTQSFFSNPRDQVDTFYSARKFFGVPDGAYLYTNKDLNIFLEKETGYDKFNYVLKRIDLGPNNAYSDYKQSGIYHSNQPIKKMSRVSQRILGSIDYDKVKKRRLDNFFYLHEFFKDLNMLKFNIDNIICPMIYPLLQTNGLDLRKYLISKGIYVAQYWPGILDIVKNDSIDVFVTNLVPLPIDQRYLREDMDYICTVYNDYLDKGDI